MVYHKERRHTSNHKHHHHQGDLNAAADDIIRTLSASPSTELTTNEAMSSFSEEDPSRRLMKYR